MKEKLIGRFGEGAAADYLRKKRYRIIGMNYSCRFGEIDLIAQDETELVFVEVKLRRSAAFSDAADAVTPAKRAKLRKTALFWFQSHGEVPARFDVLEIYDEFTPARIHWIRNAF